MEYRVLGPLEVRDGDGSLSLGGAKQRALLALLLLNANHVVSRDRLIDDLWGERPPETVVQALQVYVSRLRKLLPAETLLTRPPGYLLAIAPDELDLHRFEGLLAEGRDALTRDEPERASALLHEALALWRGPALEEFAFESFAQGEIGRLEDTRLAALEDRIEADLALGRHADVIGELETLIAENPQRERLRGALMLALYRSGRQAEALAAYQDARRALVEIGIEPSGELRRLEKAILTHDESLASPQFARRATLQAPQPQLLLVATAALIVVAVIAGAVVLATRSSAITVPPNSVAIIDPKTDAVIGDVSVGSRPDSIAANRFQVWVANLDDKTLSGINLWGGKMVNRRWVAERRFPVAQHRKLRGTATVTISLEKQGTPTALALGFGAVWVAHGLLGTLSRLPIRAVPPSDPFRLKTIRVPLPDLGGFSAVTSGVAAGAGFIWIAVGNEVSQVDPKSREIIATDDFAGRGPSAVTYGNGSIWVTGEGDGTVTRIEPSRNRFIPVLVRHKPIRVGSHPNGIVAGRGAVWVANTGADSVSRIDPSSNSPTKIISVGKRPLGISYGAGAVWVANSGDGTVSRIDPSIGKVVATIHTGNSPRRIAVGDGKVWVTVQSR
jgi:YVTN family beta-propeller protein